MRRRSGGSTHFLISAVSNSGVYETARSSQMNAGRAEIGKRGAVIPVIGCRDRNYIGCVVTGGIERLDVIIRIVISGGRDKKHAGGVADSISSRNT